MTVIRKIRTEEIPLLEDFLYEAVFIPEGVTAPPRDIVENDDLQVYICDFGMAPDDRCLVAECDGKVVGAIWTRIMDDYGHIDDQTPSLAISLYKEYRNRGIGTELLNNMLALLRQDGYRQVSLSVQKANYALRMYQRAGFEIVADRGEEVLMLCPLSRSSLSPKALPLVQLQLPFCDSNHPHSALAFDTIDILRQRGGVDDDLVGRSRSVDERQFVAIPPGDACVRNV